MLALVAAVSVIGYVAHGADLHLPGTDAGGASPAAAPAGVRPAARHAAVPQTAVPQVAATAEPVRLEPRPLLVPGDSGDKVRELQSRLDQLDWYQPDISGDYDGVTRAAVRSFQAKRGFAVTGKVFPRTWNRLVRMTHMPTYNQMHNIMVPGPTIIGPGDDGHQVRELQARLKQIAWMSGDVTPHYGSDTTQAVEGFQRKREIPVTGEVDQRTWNRLAAMTYDPSEAELFNRTPSPSEGAPLDPRCLGGVALCIDKTTSSLRYVVDGDVRMDLDVRFGDESTPTREGQFEVEWKDADHVSTLFHTEMPYSMFFSGGQAVHYSSDFATYGYSGASHGCVNVRDYDAIARLYDLVDVGDTVVVYWS